MLVVVKSYQKINTNSRSSKPAFFYNVKVMD